MGEPKNKQKTKKERKKEGMKEGKKAKENIVRQLDVNLRRVGFIGGRWGEKLG